MEQLPQILPHFSPDLKTDSVSVYRGDLVTDKTAATGMLMLTQAFPSLGKGWFTILREMIKDDGFTESRFTDAVKHVIRTCVYPTPTVANILSWDKRVKIYTYHDICDRVTGGDLFVNYKRLENGRYVDRLDAENYSLK